MDPVITKIESWIRTEQPAISTRIQQIHRSAHDTAAAAIRRAKKWRLLPVFTLLALIASIGTRDTNHLSSCVIHLFMMHELNARRNTKWAMNVLSAPSLHLLLYIANSSLRSARAP